MSTTSSTTPGLGRVPDSRALKAAAGKVLPWMVGIRRTLHQRPEIGLDLPFTQGVIIDELTRIGLVPKPGTAISSVTAVIEGDQPGPSMVLRADMDALHLQESTELEFASQIDGAMHACGHDLHVAMLLGAAQLLTGVAHLPGRVLLVFQPGEEGHDGARVMLAEGLASELTKSSATAAFATHVFTRYESGAIHLRSGPMLASSDTIRVLIRGRGGHASAPHETIDPTLVAAHVVVALQSIISRQLDPIEPAVVTVSKLISGTTPSVIPESAHIEGTFRSVSPESRALIQSRIAQIADGICAAYGATAEVAIEPGYPTTVNDYGFTQRVRSVASELVGQRQVIEMQAPVMAAEDFSRFLELVPGAIAFIGARPPGDRSEVAPMNHSNRVVFDEKVMQLGAALHAAVALSYLEEHALSG